MKNEIKYLDWDSQFFDLKIAEIVIKNELEEIALNKTHTCDLIYVKSDSEKEYLIDGYKNEFSETKIVFSKLLESSVSVKLENIENLKNDAYTETLYNLAFVSGKRSRFKLDKKFTEKQFKALYKEWVDNSLNKTIADGILVYKKEEQILGFVTYSYKKKLGNIGLIGVNPNSQGQGIGSKLITEVETLLIGLGVKTLSIPTQLSNKQANKFYTKLGYKIFNKQYINHYWKI